MSGETEGGLLVPEAVSRFFRAKKNKLGWSWLAVWRREHQHAFTVAKVGRLDLLAEIRAEVDRSLEEGLPFEQFQESIEPTLAKHGWLGHQTLADGTVVELGTPRRLKIIYDTNMRAARAAGQWHRIEAAKRSHPYLRYSLGPSHNHRDAHVKFDGLVLPVDDPFWKTHMPPNGWGCKCRVRQVSEREAQRLGGVSKPPQLKKIPWHNQRTGKTELVPEGLSPGFDYNPGQSRSGKLLEILHNKQSTI